MTKLKIDAPRAWAAFDKDDGSWFCEPVWYKHMGGYDGNGAGNQPVRIVRESDWQAIMRVVKAVDCNWPEGISWLAPGGLERPLAALRDHLAKREQRK